MKYYYLLVCKTITPKILDIYLLTSSEVACSRGSSKAVVLGGVYVYLLFNTRCHIITDLKCRLWVNCQSQGG